MVVAHELPDDLVNLLNLLLEAVALLADLCVIFCRLELLNDGTACAAPKL